jgi:hypothetical protein
MGKEDQKSPLPVTSPLSLLLPLLLHPLSYLLSHPNIWDLLTDPHGDQDDEEDEWH